MEWRLGVDLVNVKPPSQRRVRKKPRQDGQGTSQARIPQPVFSSSQGSPSTRRPLRSTTTPLNTAERTSTSLSSAPKPRTTRIPRLSAASTPANQTSTSTTRPGPQQRAASTPANREASNMSTTRSYAPASSRLNPSSSARWTPVVVATSTAGAPWLQGHLPLSSSPSQFNQTPVSIRPHRCMARGTMLQWQPPS